MGHRPDMGGHPYSGMRHERMLPPRRFVGQHINDRPPQLAAVQRLHQIGFDQVRTAPKVDQAGATGQGGE
ncbi:hypothetical protein D3C80_1725470 [compost metagenome]